MGKNNIFGTANVASRRWRRASPGKGNLCRNVPEMDATPRKRTTYWVAWSERLRL
jgi:hypothetical protein